MKYFFIVVTCCLFFISCSSPVMYFSYKTICKDCSLQKDSLILIQISDEISDFGLDMSVTNNSDENIIFDRCMNSLTEDQILILQPITLENPFISISTSENYTSKEQINVPGFYNRMYKLNYSQSSAVSSSIGSTTSYTTSNTILIPPKTTYIFQIYDYIRGRVNYHISELPLYTSLDAKSDYVNRMMQNYVNKTYKYFIFYKFMNEEVWRNRSITTQVSNLKSYVD